VLVLGGDISSGIHLEAIVAAALHRLPAVYLSVVRVFETANWLK
jgi:hypothetical protein